MKPIAFLKKIINLFNCRRIQEEPIHQNIIIDEPIKLQPQILETIYEEPISEEPIIEPIVELIIEPIIKPIVIVEPIVEPIIEQPTLIQKLELTFVQKREIIELLFIEYKNKYPSFYKTKPRRPNFNEFSFYKLCNTVEFTSKNELRIILKNLNEKNKNNLLHLSEIQKNKCKEMDFYLFT